MESDGRYMMRNNYRYSVSLLDWCQNNDVPMLYASSASVYGGGAVFREERAHEAPLNVYGYSKFLFDQYVRRTLPDRTAQIAGFRYFNVYGPREQHKGRMASVAWHFFQQYRKDGRVHLFEGSGGYAAGEQRRDFISIDDVVKVNLDFLDHPGRCGIFNVGTGQAATFNQVAVAMVNACRAADGQPASTLGLELGGRGHHRVHTVSASAGRQISELYRSGCHPAARRWVSPPDADCGGRRCALCRSAPC